MPHARYLRGKIWELRVKARSGEYRLLYATVSERRILVLDGFKKTTQETPPREIALAEDRLADFCAAKANASKDRENQEDRNGGD